jgi:hypothetical protein
MSVKGLGILGRTPHRGWEVYYRVTDPLYNGVGGVTLGTQHLILTVAMDAVKMVGELSSPPLRFLIKSSTVMGKRKFNKREKGCA